MCQVSIFYRQLRSTSIHVQFQVRLMLGLLVWMGWGLRSFGLVREARQADCSVDSWPSVCPISQQKVRTVTASSPSWYSATNSRCKQKSAICTNCVEKKAEIKGWQVVIEWMAARQTKSTRLFFQVAHACSLYHGKRALLEQVILLTLFA